jgi:hypothetical protein
MAKAKTATRKKGSKRGKASAKRARKAAAKRITAKKAKSKVRLAGRGGPTSMTKKQRPPKAAAVIEEPAHGVVGVTGDETIQTANATPAPAPLS